MRKQLLSTLFFFVVFHLSILKAQIVEMDHFSEIYSHLTQETLIILDIDDTLLIPVQMLGCDEWFKYRLQKYHQDGMHGSQALEKSLAEWEAIRHLTRMEIVEAGTENIVQRLQDLGFCVIGLTTQGLALATRTVQQLRANHIDLTFNPLSKRDHYFLLDELGVLFRHGILFTSGKSKGRALFTLLKDMDYEPKRIVFVNDKAEHLLDVEKEAKEKHVEFIGLRYSYSDVRKAAFRPEIAEVQFFHSSFNHLLSDQEAIDLLCHERLVTSLE